ncbi:MULTISPECIES: flagellar basal-body MS-ring/collar protein FliF [unclassified Novosphingobium]|uniref:flagellar basal-body MS-ring/collar protein FliF n=1 Tax=unclassified Novosphingobium TaxID=2644732 RepID=UPI001359D70B|nr:MULTISPECIES: flagellar basal-body MS-ring/collar protein FliF [unclassified Novosphingobium]
MADLVPVSGSSSTFGGFGDASGGSVLTRLSSIAQQPAVKKMMPVFIGLSAIGGAALTWSMMAPSPQRVLYAQLGDSERAGVAEALDAAQIKYAIDNQTGALTVAEGDFYKARMLVASDGALATPETGDQMLDKLPMGASRTLEGERMRSAREHDLQLTIGQIDGVDSVRVHLAEGEKSVFVRDNLAPTASVMVRLKSGRQLSEGQVTAILNLVAASVPGLSPDAVRVVDQHGRLLSEGQGADSDRLDMQSRLETKLREQVAQLLTPMLGDGNFTTETQVQLDMDQVTAARESYDKDGVVRSEQLQQSQTSGPGQAGGVPGVLSNTPPPATQAVPGAPQGTAPANPAAPAPTNGESSTSKTYELGRQVSVSETGPGGIKRLTVAVAISADAMKGAKAKDLADLEALVSAAVGANPQRGDVVKIVTRSFEPVAVETTPFYETPWFAMVVRNGAAVLAVLLVLLLGVRPMINAMRGDKPAKAKKGKKGAAAEADDGSDAAPAQRALPMASPEGVAVEVSRAELLSRQLGLAQRIVAEKPESAVHVLRQMLAEPAPEAPSKAA